MRCFLYAGICSEGEVEESVLHTALSLFVPCQPNSWQGEPLYALTRRALKKFTLNLHWWITTCVYRSQYLFFNTNSRSESPSDLNSESCCGDFGLLGKAWEKRANILLKSFHRPEPPTGSLSLASYSSSFQIPDTPCHYWAVCNMCSTWHKTDLLEKL